MCFSGKRGGGFEHWTDLIFDYLFRCPNNSISKIQNAMTSHDDTKLERSSEADRFLADSNPLMKY